jgi:hypothetical protein
MRKGLPGTAQESPTAMRNDCVRRFHHQSRSRVAAAISPIAHEDDDQIETWMIGQGQELSGNRHTVVYPWASRQA